MGRGNLRSGRSGYGGNEDTFDEATNDLDALLAEVLLSQDLAQRQQAASQARIDDGTDDVAMLGITVPR